MILDYNTLFWGDSVLEKIIIDYDKIAIKIFNDALQKNIDVECSGCIGMTEICTWDETIIENVFMNEIIPDEDDMYKKVRAIYDEAYDSVKSLAGTFYELRILLIDGWPFRIICKDIVFSD